MRLRRLLICAAMLGIGCSGQSDSGGRVTSSLADSTSTSLADAATLPSSGLPGPVIHLEVTSSPVVTTVKAKDLAFPEFGLSTIRCRTLGDEQEALFEMNPPTAVAPNASLVLPGMSMDEFRLECELKADGVWRYPIVLDQHNLGLDDAQGFCANGVSSVYSSPTAEGCFLGLELNPGTDEVVALSLKVTFTRE